MISFDEALAIIEQSTARTDVLRSALDAAAGMTLAAPVIAGIDAPRCDVSAMDGYALRAGDLHELPARLDVVGTSYPGMDELPKVARGQCARIFTGAPLPVGCDTIAIQENVRCEGEIAIFAMPARGPHFIRRRGADFRKGEELLPKGHVLGPRSLVAAAAGDCSHLTIHARPKVVIMGTGDELVVPGIARQSLRAVPQSISVGLSAAIGAWGGDCLRAETLPDDLDGLVAAAQRAVSDADLVVVTGGASVGERDFAKAMFEPAGLELMFSKVAMKPGKPVWLGKVGSALVMGLPGNPTSAMVTARLLLAPLLRVISGGEANDALRWHAGRLSQPLPATGDRETFVRAAHDRDGIRPLAYQDSGAQLTLAQADLLVRCPAGMSERAIGETVEIIDF